MLYKEIPANAYKLNIGSPTHCFDSCDFLRKEASAESVDYFNELQAEPGHLYFLVVAMTAGEFYGSNRNGDYFKERDLNKKYKMFENAGVFWNHDNKDPSKSFGKVLKSFWNDKMKRIELVIDVPEEKARYLKDYIDQGKPISVSMGLKVPQEWCSICGHETKHSYANRCEHLKFMMNSVLHDGKKVYAISGSNFSIFDISFVFRPADRTAYAMLTKSASRK